MSDTQRCDCREGYVGDRCGTGKDPLHISCFGSVDPLTCTCMEIIPINDYYQYKALRVYEGLYFYIYNTILNFHIVLYLQYYSVLNSLLKYTIFSSIVSCPGPFPIYSSTCYYTYFMQYLQYKMEHNTYSLDVFYLWTDNACHNIISKTIIQLYNVLPTWEVTYLKKPKWAKRCTIKKLFLMKNCDMRYMSKDKTHPNRSSMSKNFYNHNTYRI